MRIRVRVTANFEIDPEAWAAAGIKADWYSEGEIDPSDHQQVAQMATGGSVTPASTLKALPRWARDSVRVICEHVEVIQ